MNSTSIHIELQLSAEWNSRSPHYDLRTPDEISLHYDLLLGDLILRANGVDFSAKWGWIPLLDLALGLREMCDEIAGGELETEFEFTESDAWLRFSKRGDSFEISASYARETTEVSLSEFRSSFTSAARVFFTTAESSNPELCASAEFQNLRDKVMS